MTFQAQMKATLEKTNIAHKEIKVFGSQIIITCWSRSAAEKWVGVLAKFSTVRGIVESRDETIDQPAAYNRSMKSKGWAKNRMTHKVWRVGAYIPTAAR